MGGALRRHGDKRAKTAAAGGLAALLFVGVIRMACARVEGEAR